MTSTPPPRSRPSKNSTTPRRWLLPREHGAYGQLGYPLVCALTLGQVRAGAMAFIAAAIALFFAHEPLIVLRGERGRRRQDIEGQRARWQLALWCAIGAVAGGAGLYLSRGTSAWMFAIAPGLLALAGAAFLLKGRERTTEGEVVIALAFATTLLPVAAACGAPMQRAVLAALTWAAVSSLHVLAVRGLMARGRANGSSRYAGIVTGVAGLLFAAMAIAYSLHLVPLVAWVSIVPAVLVTAAFFMWPPPLKRLKAVGWTLMGSSTATLLVLVLLGRV